MKKNTRLITSICLAVVTICLFIIMIVLSVNGANAKHNAVGQANSVGFSGIYSINNDEFGSIDELNKIGKGEQLVIARGSFSEDVYKNQALMFNIAYQTFTMLVNGEEVYSFGHQSHGMFKTAGNVWVTFVVENDILTTDEIEIILQSPDGYLMPSDYKRFFNSIYYGYEGGLYRLLMIRGGIGYVFGVFLIISSIALIIVSIIYKNHLRRSYFSLSLLLLGFAALVMSNIAYLSLIIPFPYLNDVIIYGLIMMSSVFSIHYIKTFMSIKLKQIFDIMSWIYLVIIIAFIILQLTGTRDLYYLMRYYIIMVMICAVSLFIGLCYEYAHIGTESIKAKITMISFSILLIMALLDSILYQMINNVYFLGLGIIGFVLGQFVVFGKEIKEDIERKDKIVDYEKELLESRISLMLNQIQPHFLFNSLTSIRYLCNNNPKAAGKAIEHFAKYLRKNTEAVVQNALVSFEQEINHLDNYLYLEQLRFKDMINIKYDFETKDFFLPALTIQPIVENAIKYGISHRDNGGTVSISTKELIDYYEIIVKDDGVGFDTEKYNNDGKLHIGIENVKNRLIMMCAGSLEIESEKQVGTKVIMRIPKGYKDESNSSR